MIAGIALQKGQLHLMHLARDKEEKRKWKRQDKQISKTPSGKVWSIFYQLWPLHLENSPPEA